LIDATSNVCAEATTDAIIVAASAAAIRILRILRLTLARG
jgi:hypothetical protein